MPSCIRRSPRPPWLRETTPAGATNLNSEACATQSGVWKTMTTRLGVKTPDAICAYSLAVSVTRTGISTAQARSTSTQAQTVEYLRSNSPLPLANRCPKPALQLVGLGPASKLQKAG